jgi:hypothetical protein
MPAATPADWEEITPQHLIPAVRHVRNSFDKSAFTYRTITWKLCYASLYRETKDGASTQSPAETLDFAKYLKIVGDESELQFRECLKIGTPSAVLKAHVDLWSGGMEIAIRTHFTEALRIGLANHKALSCHPVDWAKALLGSLIAEHNHEIKLWIRDLFREPPARFDDDDWILGTHWQSPKLVHMQPFANTPFDHSTAWTLEDVPYSEKLLTSLAGRFAQTLEFLLDNIAGLAHVETAKKPPLDNSIRPADGLVTKAPPISKAPRPPSEVGGHVGGYFCEDKRTSSLDYLPPHYPATLGAETHLIVCKAAKRFPVRSGIADLCKYVLSKLRSHLRKAIVEESLPKGIALSAMDDLIRLILDHNCDSRSRQLELMGELKRSDDWLKIIRIIAISKPLSSRISPMRKRKLTEKSRNMAKAKPCIAMLWRQQPQATHKEIVQAADTKKIPVPWRSCNNWNQAWARNEGAVKVFLSKAKSLN